MSGGLAQAPEQGEATTVAEMIDDLAHLLPQQTPLHAFVHHNTLHAFEHLSFEDAVVEGARTFGTEPYMTEEAFAAHIERGRILSEDLEAVVLDDVGEGGSAIFQGAPTRARFRAARLRTLFEIPAGAALAWELTEGGALTHWHSAVDVGRRAALLRAAERGLGPLGDRTLAKRTLVDLWSAFESLAPDRSAKTIGPRRRDQILACGGRDTDLRVHPFLTRLTAAYLDQGISYWPMPERDRGFLTATRRLYGRRLPSPDPWFRGLAATWRQQERDGWDALRTIEWALDELGLPAERHAESLKSMALSLRGWAGMVRQFELRPDQAPVEPRPATLADYLAVQLTLDLFAARRSLRLLGLATDDFAALEAAVPTPRTGKNLELAFEAFVLAQALKVDITKLEDPANVRSWLAEVAAFHNFERRRVLHLAYERRHRVGVLDGVIAHSRMAATRPPAPRFQAVFCIDDRECSTRRHLEESYPDVETFGYAGFFGVAMAYKGLEEIRATPLCPVNVVPEHRVDERALRPEEEEAYHASRRRVGSVANSLSVGNKRLAGGVLLTTPLGFASVIPLIGRCLFPRFTERIAHRLHRKSFLAPPPTRLALLRRSEELDADGRKAGYSFEEMADIVESLLRTTALSGSTCRLVLIVGHGSSSLNNPHEAAHDCGATGGGRGGPNARAFAAMANRAEVRELLTARGLALSAESWFIGAYHNTCDDSMTYYDQDLVPDDLAGEFEHARRSMGVACEFDAHERCRRFDTAPSTLRVDDAMAHAESHSVDLAQPRPEYGHATNAVAIVGPRDRTRGLFLDRRAFLISYDATTDADGSLLVGLLGAIVPVGAGINLEYYFSFVDPVGYGCGTKLPHNISGLIGVMNGHGSDLRTGLPWQMVEIHEPVRLLTIVEAPRESLERFLDARPDMAEFLRNGWIQLVRWEPGTDEMEIFTRDGFVEYVPEHPRIPVVQYSPEFYSGHAGHLGCARANAALAPNGGARRTR